MQCFETEALMGQAGVVAPVLSYLFHRLHEPIDPNRLDIDRAFAQAFDGMTIEHVPLETLLAARERLIEDIRARTNGLAGEFLLSLHDAQPDFSLIGVSEAADLPAVRWKLINLRKLMAANPEKHADLWGRLIAAIGK